MQSEIAASYGFWGVLFALVIAHAVADFPLQGDFLARAKSPTAPIAGVPWATALWSHALIHGGAVWLVTGSPWLGLAETVAHAAIDHAKCTGRLGRGGFAFDLDQSLHLVCKLLWTLAAVLWGAHL